jgi:hypothetical protein
MNGELKVFRRLGGVHSEHEGFGELLMPDTCRSHFIVAAVSSNGLAMRRNSSVRLARSSFEVATS